VHNYIDDFKFLFSLRDIQEFDYYNKNDTQALKTNINSSALNFAASHTLPSANTIDEVKKYFGSIPFIWWVDEQQTDVAKALVAKSLADHGSFTVATSAPGMHMELKSLPEQRDHADILIKQVTTMEELEQWIEIPAGIPKEDVRKFVEPIFKQKKNVEFYLAYYKGTPVATSTIIINDNDVYVCNVVVLPEYRKKGIGYAVTHFPLQKARNMGKTSAVLHSSDMAVSLYKKMGFTMHTTFDGYIIK